MIPKLLFYVAWSDRNLAVRISGKTAPDCGNVAPSFDEPVRTIGLPIGRAGKIIGSWKPRLESAHRDCVYRMLLDIDTLLLDARSTSTDRGARIRHGYTLFSLGVLSELCRE